MARKFKNFVRRGWYRYSKLGKGRRKKQKWRKPKGRDNVMREKRKSRGKVVSIGYKTPYKKRTPVVHNLKELKKGLGEVIFAAKTGKKKRAEMAEKAKKLGIKVKNLNLNKKQNESKK